MLFLSYKTMDDTFFHSMYFFVFPYNLIFIIREKTILTYYLLPIICTQDIIAKIVLTGLIRNCFYSTYVYTSVPFHSEPFLMLHTFLKYTSLIFLFFPSKSRKLYYRVTCQPDLLTCKFNMYFKYK